MQLQPVVTFRGITASAALESDIRRRIAKLQRYYPRMIGCRVLVAQPGRHRCAGRAFNVRIDMSMPQGHVEISHAASLRADAREAEQDSYRKQDASVSERRYATVAVREAFESARRRLQDFGRRQRGDIKTRSEARD
jgi:ribosome-associated translation inhibitor RaiA